MNTTIGVVSEGPTDFELIRALVYKILPGEHTILPLQPELSETEGFGGNIGCGAHGGGWKGVASWCDSIATDFHGISSFLKTFQPVIDLLIIHVDADIARDSEINCPAPCPPVDKTVKNLKGLILGWLKEGKFPKEVICCIPCDNTEAWILCAYDIETPHHMPPELPLECIHKPDYIISDPGYRRPNRLLKRKDGKPKKNVANYRGLIPQVLKQWEDVKSICLQAKAFEDALIGNYLTI